MPNTADDIRAAGKSGVAVDFEAWFQDAPCGYLIVGDDGLISAVNQTFLRWAGHSEQALLGTSFARLLPVGDRILYSTHVAPQLRVNGSVAEVVIEIVAADGRRRPALLSATRTPRSATEPGQTRVIIFSAAERRSYEQELIAALQRARESDARRLKAQEAAEATQSFQDAVFAATPDTIAVWEMNTATMLWTNRPMSDQWGDGNEEASAVATHLATHLVVDEDVDTFTAALTATCAAADRQVVEVEFRMKDADARTRWFSRRTTPLRRDEGGRVTQIIGITREITAEKTVANDLRESERLFRQLAESVDVAFFLRAGDPPEFLYASPAFAKIFGFDPMVTGETPVQGLSHVHPEDRERFQRDYWIPSHQGETARIDYRLVRPDGQIRWIRSTTAPVAQVEPGPRRYATTSEDITKSREAEAALLAVKTAERANAAKNDFLSRMSHELRTPLNAVLGFAQLLELDPLTSEQQSGVQYILRGGRHLLELIDDVLDISKIESDHLDLSLELVPVVAMLSETVHLMTPQAVGAGISLCFEPTGLRYRIHADQRRLRQVLINLLSNAIKYNRKGGRVVVRCRTAVSESGTDGRLDIDVTDCGQGIRPQDLPRLFTPFDRLGKESTSIEGSGVGLALSHRLTTLMGGTLTATSEVGVGSTFTLSFPLVGPGEDPAATVAALAPAGPPVDDPPRPRTLLYIEDNSSNVELMQQLIRRRPGWRMLIAGDGELGVELAATAGLELVLLDLHLPDTDGMVVLRTLRADPATQHLKVVMLSADANPHQQERLCAAGADAYLTKPIDVAKVLALLDGPPSGS